MTKCYQYNAEGYFQSEDDDYGMGLPHNATYIPPNMNNELLAEHNIAVETKVIPFFQKAADADSIDTWIPVENHKNTQGYLGIAPFRRDDYAFHTIEKYGPLPEHFVVELPAYTLEELKMRKKEESKKLFSEIQAKGHCLVTVESGASFEVDADANSVMSVSHLIENMESHNLPTTKFRGYDNIFYDVTLADAKTIKASMNDYTQQQLKKKWNYLALIEGYSTFEELESLLITYDTV